MMKTSMYLSAAMALVGLVSSIEAEASVFVFDNTSNASQGAATVGQLTPTIFLRRAESFTVGAQSYALDSIDIKISGSANASGYTISLWSNSGSQHPSAQVLSFTTSTFNNGSPTLVNFTPVSGFTLAAGTKYWIVAQASGSTTFNVDSVTSSGGNSMDVDVGSPSFTGAWGSQSSLAISSRVSGTAVPEPASFAAIASLGCAGLYMLRRRQNG